MEKEIEMDLHETRMAKQTEGTELSEDALEDATGGDIRGPACFTCARCHIYYSQSRYKIGKNGEWLCGRCKVE